MFASVASLSRKKKMYVVQQRGKNLGKTSLLQSSVLNFAHDFFTLILPYTLWRFRNFFTNIPKSDERVYSNNLGKNVRNH